MTRETLIMEEDPGEGKIWVKKGGLTWSDDRVPIIYGAGFSTDALVGYASSFRRDGTVISAELSYFGDSMLNLAKEMEKSVYVNQIVMEDKDKFHVKSGHIKAVTLLPSPGFPKQ